MKKIIFFAVLAVWCLTSNALTFEVDGLKYTVNNDGATVTVSKGSKTTGELIIPETVSYGGNTYSVTAIGNSAFSRCSGFTGSLTIPNSVTTIGDFAFDNCRGFTGSLTIPNSITSIGRSAFEYCVGFTGSLIIPNSVTSIGNTAFHDCSGFTGSLSIGNSVTSIGDLAFYGCSGFTGSLTIPNSVTSIGNGAFHDCNGFTGSLTIGNSVTTIGKNAFYDCSGFTGSLTIGNSVTSIGEKTFYNCSNFTGSLTIPNSVTAIGNAAFESCCGFTGSLTIGNSVTSISERTFLNCSGFTGSLTIPNSVTTIGNLAFLGCSGFTGSLTIPNSVTTIGKQAFDGCSGFTGSLTIPNSVTTIGDLAFCGCSGFTGTLTIGNSVTTIGDLAFFVCSGFTGSLTIPNSVTAIGDAAFLDCSGFTSLTIPNSVTSIGQEAFGCSSFADIYTEILNPFEVTLGTSVFSSVNKQTCVLHVPAGTLNDYKVADQWRDFIHIQEPFTAITTLELSPKNAEVLEGGTIAITPVFTPSYATNQTLTWTSSDETIATVDEQGVVTGVKVGNTTISATTTDGSDITATCQVTVKPVVATGISVDPIAVTITAGETTQLSVTMTPANATYKTATWSSSDEAIATVDENGVVTGIAAGQAQVTATTIDGTNLSATSVVTVLPRKATDITISPDSVVIDISGSVHLTATIAPEDVESNVLLWESSDEDVAIVTSKGMVYGVGAGQALITATTTDGSNLSDTCHVTVRVPFELTAQSLAIPVNARRNIPIMIDNHVDVKSFAFTVNLPDSIRITGDAFAAPRCGDFNITTSYNADSTVVHIEGVMTSTAMGAGTGAFVLLPVKSCSLIDDFYAELTSISFTSTNDGVGTQLLDDVTVSIHVLNLGDANGDKLVNVNDVTTLINYILGIQSDLTNFGVGDINNDGRINVSDVTALINLILGIDITDTINP